MMFKIYSILCYFGSLVIAANHAGSGQIISRYTYQVPTKGKISSHPDAKNVTIVYQQSASWVPPKRVKSNSRRRKNSVLTKTSYICERWRTQAVLIIRAKLLVQWPENRTFLNLRSVIIIPSKNSIFCPCCLKLTNQTIGAGHCFTDFFLLLLFTHFGVNSRG